MTKHFMGGGLALFWLFCSPARAGLPSGVPVAAPPAAALYGARVCVEAGAGSDVGAMASELVLELEDMTGVEFRAITNSASGPGIFLLRRAADLAARYADLGGQQADLTNLATKGTEAFFIYSTGSNSLYLVGNSDAALTLGAYYYLRKLGWRALLPGANWTIKPMLASVMIAIDDVREPAFRQRQFFGTGGFGGSLPLDPAGRVEDEWTRWKKVNQFGGSIAIAGHEGEDFNLRNEALLQAHAEMRAYDRYPDSHVPYDLIMKPDASNPALQALYVGDRVAAYNPASYAVSVEPADGDGFCVCPFCTQHDPVSSQVFGLAKRAADGLNAAHPGAMVSLYAYNTHAAVPADPALRDWLANSSANVYVNVIPYAFQRTGLDGDQLAAAWAAAKPVNRGIYDYWAIPDWSNNLPDQNLDDSIRKLRYWASLGYDGLASESTTSGGSVGLLWYMAGRLMVDPGEDPTALREEFYRLAFGAAVPPMRRMIERWGRDFTLTEQELGCSFLDIAEARALAAGDPGALARVNDYARYVQYIRLWFEYQKTTLTQASGEPARHAAAEAVLKFLWQINDSDMVHTFRMSQLITLRYEYADTALWAAWDYYNTDAAGWTWVKANPLTDGQLTALVSSGVTDYATAPNHVPFEQPVFSGNLMPLNPAYTLNGQLTAQAEYLYGDAAFVFYAKPGVPSLNFTFTPYLLGDTASVNRVWVYDPGGVLVYSNSFGGNGVYGSNNVPVTFTVPTATSGNYTLRVYDPKKSFFLAAEENLPFVLTSPLTSSYQIDQKAFFYVPGGMATVSLYAPGALPVLVKDADGHTLSPSFGNGLGESDYTVPSGQDGRVWSMGNLKCYSPGAWPLNAPRLWSFSPAGMMVPSNAPPSVDAGLDAAIVAPTHSVALNGTVTDDHLSANPYWSAAWIKVSGPGTVTFGASTAVDTTASLSATGTYVLRLTVTDTGGRSATDEVCIVYGKTPPNAAPVVNAGSDATLTLPTGTISLAGTVTDDSQPSPPARTHWWTEVRGPGNVIFADSSAAGTAATFDEPGSYRLRLTVSDGALAAYDEMTVVAIPDYQAPTYRVGDQGAFGTPTGFDYNNTGQFFDAPGKQYSARFRARESVTVDRVYQRILNVDTNTPKLQIGIMADDGRGNPGGTFLASTAPDYVPQNGLAWAVFTNAVTLQALQVYHVVTRITTPGANRSMIIRCSGSESSIRPYDRATDTAMIGLMSSDTGQTWTVRNLDPFFTLGMGSVVVAGPGNTEQTEGWSLQTQGGTGKALGQKFVISTREVPAAAFVVCSNLSFEIWKYSAVHDLIVKLRQGDGTVLGTITRPAADIAATSKPYTWAFDGGATVRLEPGKAYYLTTELGAGSGASEYYDFKSIYADGATMANTWGGTTACVPVQSGAGNDWLTFNWASPTPYAGREPFDLWFRLDGVVWLPAGLARSPAALAPACEQGQNAAAQCFQVWNAGADTVTYSISDEAAWLSVDPDQGTSTTGHDTIQVTYRTAGLAPGTYNATITIDGNGASNSPQTVAVALTVTPVAGALPFADSFEPYPDGLAIAGTNGWTGEDDAATVGTVAYAATTPPGFPLPTAAHTKGLRLAGTLAHPVNGDSSQNVNVDFMMLAVPRNPLPDSLSNTVQTAFCVDSNGLLQAWHMQGADSTWTQRWTALSASPIASDQWVRVSVALDYSTSPGGDTFFSPRINGAPCPTPFGYKAPDDLTSPGSWYMCANNPGRGGGGNPALSRFMTWGKGWLDDVVIGTDPFARTGDRGPGALMILR